jgi:mannose-6-phosphate isomerase-like protein (cupin superfamily)
MAVDAIHTLDTDYSKRFLLQPYLDWAKNEGPPIIEGFSIDVLAAETGYWPRYDCNGAFLHTRGRGDYCTAYALDIPPGKKTAPINHLYEFFVYVLEGHGSTVVELPNGNRHSFEWGPKSLFAIPLNARYQIFNGSGTQRALLGCTHNATVTMNLYHNEKFVFGNYFAFEDRFGNPKYYEGDGDFIPIRPGRDLWETNFVSDLSDFKLHTWQARGAGGSHVGFALADGTMHAHVSEIPTARYKKGHRHGDGVHIWAVTGTGYSLLWNQGDKDLIEVPWRHGVLYVPELWMFHQHFNTAKEPARYLAISLGSRRYPFTNAKRDGVAGETDLDIKKGGRQIEYVDQDPRVHRRWLDAIAKTGVVSDMGSYIDERPYLAKGKAKPKAKAKPRAKAKAAAKSSRKSKAAKQKLRITAKAAKPKAKSTGKPKKVKIAAMAGRRSASAKPKTRRKAKAARRK